MENSKEKLLLRVQRFLKPIFGFRKLDLNFEEWNSQVVVKFNNKDQILGVVELQGENYSKMFWIDYR